jgi:uracil phosphoribosyltransferase
MANFPMKGVTVIKHPLVQQGLTRLRDQRTPAEEFRRTLGELGVFLVYEALATVPANPVTVRTPMERTRGARLGRDILLVPVLRAGLGLLQAVLPMIPGARVGFVGLARNEETLVPVNYHQSLPARLGGLEVILLDPMLATGGSALAALDLLQRRGARRLRMVNLIAAPEGIRRVRACHRELPIFAASIDRCLNRKGYILPGLGDAGSRLFGV